MSKFKTTLLIALVVFLGLFISSQTMAAVCNVPSDRPTIQDAVNDGTCDPINVAAGTYNENIVINRPLTLQGAGVASTFINGLNTGTNVATVKITAAGNVTLSGFTITNAPVTNDGDLRFGILTNSPSTGVIYTISNNKVVGTNNPDAYEDYGIYGQSGGKENLAITNNIVTQTGANNIVVETHQGTTDISYNTLDAGCWGTDAIFVMTLSGVNVTSLQKVSYNNIDLSTGGPFDYAHRATGITFATGVTTGVGGKFTNVQITNNNLNNLKSNRRGIGFWNNSGGDGSAGNIIAPIVSDNTVTGAPGDVTASRGIDTIGLVTFAYITNNTVTGVDFGFREAVWNGHIAIGTQLNFNGLSNNSSGVVTYRSTGILNAKNNWWGSPSGPTHPGNPGGTGDPVSNNVDYRPWLITWPLTFYWKDYNGEQPGGYMPDIDQKQDFDKAAIRYEETDPNVSCSGIWSPYYDGNASGGSITYSDDFTTPASCTFTFTGSSITYIGTKSTNKGIAEVWIDGTKMTEVDLYSATLQWQQKLYVNNSLSSGQHTIMIKFANKKNPSATDKRIDVDAFEVAHEQHYCAPVAEANSLWWLDKKFDNIEIFSEPYTGTGYVGGDINDDGKSDVMDLVQELAIMMKTNVVQPGTTVANEQAGIDAFLEKYNLDDELYEHTVTDENVPDPYPDMFHYVEAEVERSQDVKLDLGFWHVDSATPAGPGQWNVIWSRRGGHAVTVAGVDSQNSLFAISDPDNDAAEAGTAPGFVHTPSGITHLYPHDTSLHNNEQYASHDIYAVGHSPSPGGEMGLLNFPWKWNLPPEEWVILPPMIVDWPEPLYESLTFTEIEAAVIVSPYPDISVSPGSLNFGTVAVGFSSTKTVTISNIGGPNLIIGTITVTGTDASQFSKQNDNCSGQTLAPSASCTVDVKFSPTSLTAKNAILRIPSNDPDENPVNLPLEGKGTKVAITSPNGGETLRSADSHTITWQTSAIVGPVAKTILKYTLNGGTTWKLIAKRTGNTGSYPWEVPYVGSIKTKCKVKVILKDAAGKTLASDMSDNNFTIEPRL